MNAYTDTLTSPIGTLTVVVNGDGALTHVLFEGQSPPAGAQADADRCAAAVTQLREYFAGERTDFDLPLAPAGSAFQRQVWDELQRVGYGAVTDYRGLGGRIGRPHAARAVGRANATNPIPIIIPCHRVIGANGSLTGYAGGLEAKRLLLELESRAAAAVAA
ncbi:methylated-DNA--[protein]-cysteine S-methyltransferase [Longimicrobium sp.]|uniref:methylated-DNA--[protein]-cysteine S-methyltransferase n=1 Tax=Longimicrobium sp. TaxID=2029185 RepID=UPI002E37864E|nr:methylated-DNA--[protein]-cysteine S-methyltransferase [Longimicrobium sp.]HEX6040505.1 methylated-DNA--[protein]-cysteine S-methyltransferase [Longimicrobium sp.]